MLLDNINTSIYCTTRETVVHGFHVQNFTIYKNIHILQLQYTLEKLLQYTHPIDYKCTGSC